MSAVRFGALAPDRPQSIHNPRTGRERPSCCGVRGRFCPGRDRDGGQSNRRFRFGAAGFAAAFPADFPALRFLTAFLRSGGPPSTIYFFFFFAAFLAFLFFAITGLHRKLRKESTKPVHAATVYSVAGISPVDPNPFASRHWERAAWKKIFRSIFRDHRKNISAALHIMSKAARNISRQNGAKQAATDEFELHSITIITRKRHGLDTLASRRR